MNKGKNKYVVKLSKLNQEKEIKVNALLCKPIYVRNLPVE